MEIVDRLEAEQEQERLRRNLIRRAVRTLSCPKCKAVPNQPCYKKNDEYRISNHKERQDKALASKVIVKKPAKGRPGHIYTLSLQE